MRNSPYCAPCGMAIDLGGISFGLVQDVDFFLVSEKHLVWCG